MDIQRFFKDIIGVSDRDLRNHLAEVAEFRMLKKNERLISIGEKVYYVYFLINGVVRGFLTDEHGNEMTDCFAYKCGDLIMSVEAFEKFSSISFDAMVETVVLRIPAADIIKNMKQHRELENLYNKKLLEALHVQWEIKKVFYRLSASERYSWFQEDYPGLINTVPLHYVASFLNMAPQSLSRIRHKVGGGV
jgi:CRP-like cAMP-binding protein